MLVFFKAFGYANPKAERDFAGSVHIFQDIYFEISQIHLLTTMYRFKHTDHDILLNFLFQNLCKFILRARNLHK